MPAVACIRNSLLLFLTDWSWLSGWSLIAPESPLGPPYVGKLDEITVPG